MKYNDIENNDIENNDNDHDDDDDIMKGSTDVLMPVSLIVSY
jgi:hypothetical protein